MLKLNYVLLQNPNFIAVVRKLANYPFRAVKVSYNISRINDKLDQEAKRAQEGFIKLAKAHALLDDKGEFVPMKDEAGNERPFTFQIPDENEKAWHEAKVEFDKFEFEIDRYPLKLSELGGCALSAAEIAMITPLIDADDAEGLDKPASQIELATEMPAGPALVK
jgi:hypothetical protein